MESKELKQMFLGHVQWYKTYMDVKGYDLSILDKRVSHLYIEVCEAETVGALEMTDLLEIKKTILDLLSKIRYTIENA